MQRILLYLFLSIAQYVSRRFLRPSSGAQNCKYSVRYCQTNTAACCYRGWDGTAKSICVETLNNYDFRISRTFISINCSTCFRRFLRPSSGAQKCKYSVRYCQTNTAACCYRGWDGTQFHLTHDSSRQQYWFDNTWRCIYSFVLPMMGGGTAWNMQSNWQKQIYEKYIASCWFYFRDIRHITLISITSQLWIPNETED